MSDRPEVLYKRMMLRSAFQSLFWNVLLDRKRTSKFTLTALADKLGINKSYVSRSFSNPPNWQIDKISDMAAALELDLEVHARDRSTGLIYTPNGIISGPVLTYGGGQMQSEKPRAEATGVTPIEGAKLVRASAL